MEIFNSVGTWLGYVGACVATPDATCLPLLAFVSMALAASAALALVLMAFSNAQRRDAAALEERTHRNADVQHRLRRAAAIERAAAKPMLGGLRPAA